MNDDPTAGSTSTGESAVTPRSPLNVDDATFFETLVMNASEGLLTLDEDGTIVYANPAVERILGYDPADLVGSSKPTLVPERLRSAHAEGFKQYLDLGEERIDWDERELPALHADGHEVPISISLREHEHDGQRLFTGIIRDLSERRAYEETLQQQHTTVEQLLETSPIGITVVDADGKIVRANTYAGVIYDQDPNDLEGRLYESVVGAAVDETGAELPPDDHPIARSFVTAEPVYDEVIGVRPTAGRRRWLSMSAAPISGPDGGVDRVVTAIEDVSERREREQRLHAFREAIDHAAHAICVTDTDGTIEYVNAAFEDQTGYAAAEAIGGTPRILKSGEHDEAHYTDLWETILSGEVWSGEVVNRRKTGDTYTINQTIAPVLDGDGTVERFVAVNADVTERKKRERALERQRDALEHQRNTLERLRQITASLNSIHNALIRSSTREELEQLVCDALGSSEAYADAWIGEYVAAEKVIEPRAWTGSSEADVVDALNADATEAGIVERTIRTGDVQAAQSLPSASGSERRLPERARQRGYNAAAAVPLTHGTTVYGALCLYSTRSFAFEPTERQLLGELGERIGHTIRAIENRQLLYADTRIELEFRCADSDVSFVGVTERLGCKLTLEKSTPARGGAFVIYAGVEGASPERVAADLESSSAVEGARPVRATGDRGTVEFRVIGPSPVLLLLDQGATPRSVVVEDGEARIVAEIALEADTRGLVERLLSQFPDTEFVSKRTIDRAVPTDAAHANPLEALTDRQWEVLEAAYHAGYFDSPRRTSGEELAETLGISSATFYQHVRKGSRNLLDGVTGSARERGLGD